MNVSFFSSSLFSSSLALPLSYSPPPFLIVFALPLDQLQYIRGNADDTTMTIGGLFPRETASGRLMFTNSMFMECPSTAERDEWVTTVNAALSERTMRDRVRAEEVRPAYCALHNSILMLVNCAPCRRRSRHPPTLQSSRACSPPSSQQSFRRSMQTARTASCAPSTRSSS